MSLNTRLTMPVGVLLLAIIGIIASTLWVTNAQKADGLAMNLTGRQRMLIQRFAKEILQEANNRQEVARAELRARIATAQIMADRRYYARNVIAKLANDWEDFQASDNHRDVPGAIPLPATFVREVSESLDPAAGYQYELLSNWNINENQGLRDAFHQKAWESLSQDPDTPYVDLIRDGEGVGFRFATADVAATAVCVACHNQHPKSPKNDFQLNDLMGILVVSVPVTLDKAKADVLIAAGDRNAPLPSAKTRKLFEQTLAALQHGGKTFTDPSATKPVTLPATCTPRITEQLVEVEALWKSVTEATSVIESEPVGTQAYVASLTALPGNANDCLREMDLACGMYQEDSESRVKMVTSIHYGAGMISLLTAIGLVMYIRIKVSRPLVEALRTREERNRAQESLREAQENLLNRQRKEKELVEAELAKTRGELVKKTRLATLGQLTATVSHELRNPLGTIRTAVYSVAEEVRGSTPRVDRALVRAERNIVRCDQIIEELLDFTRTKPPNPRPTDVDRWLHAVLDEQDVPDHVTVARNLTAGVELAVDREQLRRCVVNLLTNAYQAMAETPPEDARLTVQTAAEDDRLLVRIGDTGRGIDREAMDRVFEPLYTTKGFGVGLGLPMVDQLMRQLGGGVTIQSEPGRGATATLWLPLAPEEEP